MFHRLLLNLFFCTFAPNIIIMPIDPLSEILLGLPEAFQFGKGIADLFSGNAFGNAQRPWETVPVSVQRATALGRNRSMSPILPGASTITGQIGANTSAGVNTAIQGGNPQGNIGALVNNQNTQLQNLGFEGVTHQDKALDEYGRQLNTQGEYEQKAWDWNYAKPYEYSQAASNTYREGGLGEIFSSLKGGGQTYMLLDMMNKLKDKNTNLNLRGGGAGGN